MGLGSPMRDPLIYPALPGEPVSAEQLSPFIPLADEVSWARKHTRSPKRQLELLVMLKTSQRHWRFPLLSWPRAHAVWICRYRAPRSS